jgi:hypothetical protein
MLLYCVCVFVVCVCVCVCCVCVCFSSLLPLQLSFFLFRSSFFLGREGKRRRGGQERNYVTRGNLRHEWPWRDVNL